MTKAYVGYTVLGMRRLAGPYPAGSELDYQRHDIETFEGVTDVSIVLACDLSEEDRACLIG